MIVILMSNSLSLTMFALFVMGFFTPGCGTTSYVLILESMPHEWRGFTGSIANAAIVSVPLFLSIYF
jgi:hypothetical protein